jgi:hypothetical protein
MSRCTSGGLLPYLLPITSKDIFQINFLKSQFRSAWRPPFSATQLLHTRQRRAVELPLPPKSTRRRDPSRTEPIEPTVPKLADFAVIRSDSQRQWGRELPSVRAANMQSVSQSQPLITNHLGAIITLVTPQEIHSYRDHWPDLHFHPTLSLCSMSSKRRVGTLVRGVLDSTGTSPPTPRHYGRFTMHVPALSVPHFLSF